MNTRLLHSLSSPPTRTPFITTDVWLLGNNFIARKSCLCFAWPPCNFAILPIFFQILLVFWEVLLEPSTHEVRKFWDSFILVFFSQEKVLIFLSILSPRSKKFFFHFSQFTLTLLHWGWILLVVFQSQSLSDVFPSMHCIFNMCSKAL